mgnify:CR=1 FL=1
MLISTDYSSGRLTIRLSGELDHHVLIDEYLPRDTAIDMSGLSFMDSSGIALILRTERRMREMGGRAAVLNPGKQPLRVIDASGIDRLIQVKGAQRQ